MSLHMAGAVLVERLLAAAFLAQIAVILILLVAAALIYRSFRERFLHAWLLGWVAYLAYEVTLTIAAAGTYRALWAATAHVAFLLAMAQFAGAVLFYAGDPQRLGLVRALALAGVTVVAIQDLWLGQWALLTWAVYACGAAMVLVAGQRLVRFARGRSTAGPWLLLASLLALHPHNPFDRAHYLPAVDVTIELIAGFSMLLMVLDDLRARDQRLNVASAINRIIEQSEDPQVLLQGALQEIRTLIGADAAWVRFLEGSKLELQAHIGLSPEYVAARQSLPVQESFSGHVLQAGRGGVIRTSQAPPETRARLRQDGFDHVLVVPIRGKSSPIGTLATASHHYRWYTRDERQFLTLAADQLGIAVENMRMLDQVLRSKMQWVHTFDSIEDAILVHDRENRVLRVNRALVQRLERHPTEVVNRPVEQVLPGGGEKWQGCPYCARGMEGLEAPDACFGGYSVVGTSAYSDGEQAGTIHIIRDTTGARAAEQRYRQLFEGMQEGVFLSTEEGRLLDCNDAFVRLLGYPSREELLSVDISRELYADPAQRLQFRREMSEKHYVRGFESLLRRRDGKLITVMENSSLTRDPEGRVCYQGFVLDVTARKNAEEQSRRRNRELFALNRILTVAAQSMDLDEILNLAVQNVVEVFEADCGSAFLFDAGRSELQRRATFGLTSRKARNLSSLEVPPELVRTVRESHTEILTQQHLHYLPQAVQELVAAEGLHSWMWTILWSHDEAVGLIGVATRSARDFTAGEESLMIAIARHLGMTVQKVRLYEATMKAYDDLQRTQEQLLQSEKMSAIGQLISGVAHELNNPLTAILGYAQLLETGATPERVADFAGKLYRQAQRTQKIVQNLLSFARQRQPEQRFLDLRKVIDDTVTLRDYDLKLNNIAVERDYQADLPPVLADPHQLEQVFLNIVNNAVDAILEHERKGRIGIRCYAEDAHAVVELRDSGPGISDPGKVFDPFYTTKPIGKGTGLGLSICYSIVKQHGGEIIARNHPEGGAVFELCFPLVRAAGRAAEPLAEYPRVALSGRILLVDDEEPVLDFESEVLRASGAEVVTAANGEEALRRLKSEHFDAIVTDAKMPGKWTGLELYRWVVKARPELRTRFVLTVSNVGDPEVARFLKETGIACMAKPFEMADFVGVVRHTIESVPAAVRI
jgi:PAS domain S-box-containing protein